MDTFGEWLRYQRNQLRLTREQFAQRIGCSIALLRKIEDGERRPSAQIAELMASCLSIPLEERVTFVKVARGELSLDRLSPILKPGTPSTAPRINLPVLPTPMIGRQREVEELNQLLYDPQCRLLTLVGPGGIGKTRLAIETATQMQDVFAEGVFFVSLAPVNSTRFIVPMIADAIGFTFESDSRTDPKAQLFSYLNEKQALLLLDNLEQLLTEHGIEMLDELLAKAPRVKLLVTSREALGWQNEWVFEVEGLPIPEAWEAEEKAQNTSVELFLQRARRAYVGFEATPEVFPSIIRICVLVGGMPLAIELAAAWVRTLSCEEIATEIERGLDFLSVSARDLPTRHRSMRAVFDQSWRLLTEGEREVLLRLSVFRGGFRREAAEQVAQASLAVLSDLLSKSLVRRSGDGRYDLHELIRQYTTEQFAEHLEEQIATRSRHSSYYLTHFCQADKRLRSSAQRETLAELTIEMDNFRVAWDWALAHNDFALLCQASVILWYLFELRSGFAEGETVFRDAAEAIQSHTAMEIDPHNEVLTAVNIMRAHSAYHSFRLGKSTLAYDALISSAAYLQSSTNQFAGMYALWYLGMVCWVLGKYEDANRNMQISFEQASVLGEIWYKCMIGQFIGIISLDKNDYNLAYHYLSEALVSARETGEPTLIAHTLLWLSQTIKAMGENAEAVKLLNEGLTIAQEIGWRHGIGRALDGLGLLTQVTNPKEARNLFTASCDVLQEIGDLRTLSSVFNHQGYNSITLGDVVDAKNSFISGLRLAREGSYITYSLDALVGLAMIWAKDSDQKHALELVIHVQQYQAATQDTLTRAERLRAELETRLTQRQLEALQAQAQAKTLEVVVDEILMQSEED